MKSAPLNTLPPSALPSGPHTANYHPLDAAKLDRKTPLFQEIQQILVTGYGIHTLSNGLKIHLFSEGLKGGCSKITNLGSVILDAIRKSEDKPNIKAPLENIWSAVYDKELLPVEEKNNDYLEDFQSRFEMCAESTEKKDFEDCIEGITNLLKSDLKAAFEEVREYKIEGLFKETINKTNTWLKDFETLYKKMESLASQSPPPEIANQSTQGSISGGEKFIQNFSGTIKGNFSLGDTTHTTVHGSQYHNENSKIAVQGNDAKIETINL